MLGEHAYDDKCPKGHSRSWKCHQPSPQICAKCDDDKRKVEKAAFKARQLQDQQDREEREYLEHLAHLDSLIADERQRTKDAQIAKERALALEQKEKDLTQATTLALGALTMSSSSANQSPAGKGSKSPARGSSQSPAKASVANNQASVTEKPSSYAARVVKRRVSPAKQEWQSQKAAENLSNSDFDAVMDMIGLEEVKLQILRIKAKVEVSIRQNSDMGQDRLNVAFMGNPGTGMFDSVPLYQLEESSDFPQQARPLLLACMLEYLRRSEHSQHLLSSKPRALAFATMVSPVLKSILTLS